MTDELNSQLRELGVVPPGDRELQRQTGGTVRLLLQGDPAQYAGTPLTVGYASQFACGAASFAMLANSATGGDLKVGNAADYLMRKGVMTADDGLLVGQDMSRLVPLFREHGVDAVPQNFTQESLRQHFANGGGPVMFSGPQFSRATRSGWPHIYVVTGVNDQGVEVADPAGRYPRLTWNQWQQATGAPDAAAGAGIFVRPQAGAPAAPAGRPVAAATTGAPAASGASPLVAKPTLNEPEVRTIQQRIMSDMPRIGPKPRGESLDQAMQRWAPALEWIEQQTGLSAEGMAGLISAESSFGANDDSDLAIRDNNYVSMETDPNDRYMTGPSRYSEGGRFAAYPTPEAMLARTVGVLLHPENTYNDPRRGAALAANRRDPNAVAQHLVRGCWIIDEPGHPVSGWLQNNRAGADRYRRVVRGAGRTT